MSETIRNTIAQLLQESRSFNKNDVLVHAAVENKRLHFSDWSNTILVGDFPSGILKETRKTIKESGVNTLCFAEGVLEQTSGDTLQKSPILLTPVSFKMDKVRGVLHLERSEEATFVNPYIEYLLDANDVHTNWDTSTILDVLTETGFTVHTEATPCIGNFHHHRYAVLRELESLLEQSKYSLPLGSVLGQEQTQASDLLLPKDLLLPADIDHLQVCNEVEQGNTVIQGPPGTGKSQVLANLIGKLLAAEKSSIVLSEKRVALEVLLQKLHTFGLDRLGFIVTSDTASHALLQQLEANWNYFEQAEFKKEPNLLLSEQYLAQLQFSLDVLNQPDAIGGTSLYEFREWMQTIDSESPLYFENAPTLPDLQKNTSVLQEIYAKGLSKSIAALLPKVLRANDTSTYETLRSCLDTLVALNTVVPFTTWADLSFVTKQAVLSQNRENHQEKNYSDLYKPNSRKQKRFLKLYKEWNRLQKESAAFSPNFQWNQQPNEAEMLELHSLSQNNSFFGKRRFRRTWKKYSSVSSQVASEALQERDKQLQLEKDKSQLIIDFCDLGILEPVSEIDILYHSIQSYVQSEWEILDGLSSKQTSYLTESHALLNEISATLKRHLKLKDDTRLIETLETVLQHYGEINAIQSKLDALGSSFFSMLGAVENYGQFEASVAYSHWSNFRKRFPALSEFSMDDLHEKAVSVIQSQLHESRLFADSILATVQDKFRGYHTLLNTPARQLSEEEKVRKKRLRKGKSILVKEFAKTRSHPSVRELFASEARDWIQLLLPLWLSNPTQVSKNFPLEEGLFDVAIFDEASQIPLQNGLGALQRSLHGIIAGDSQQMGPTSYFKKGTSEVVDLLHQASFHWTNCTLKHHYRSLHPALIHFSNTHFYKGELKAYPAHGMDSAVKRHFIANGVFDDRKNVEEAKAVAQELSALLDSTENAHDSLGIVAFSEEQLLCIRKQLDAASDKKLTERLESGTAFFKSLENVQGDECDRLLISFGYGKDPDGNFAMRFGPMNTENGRRRLNVLLTRARKRMDFFTSVAYADFKLSDNESIDLLRQWFAHLEATAQTSDVLDLPFDADYSTQNHVLLLRKPHNHFNQAEEFVTFQSVMENRGWQLSNQ